MVEFEHYEDSLRKYKDFVIRRSDPYGFWSIESGTRKAIPAELNQSFTSAQLAGKAIDIYLDNLKKKVK